MFQNDYIVAMYSVVWFLFRDGSMSFVFCYYDLPFTYAVLLLMLRLLRCYHFFFPPNCYYCGHHFCLSYFSRIYLYSASAKYKIHLNNHRTNSWLFAFLITKHALQQQQQQQQQVTSINWFNYLFNQLISHSW